LSKTAPIFEIAELELAFKPARWSFAETQASGIAAYWARIRKSKPTLFNGRVLLLRRAALEARADGGLKMSGAYFETDYADFLAWRDFGHPGDRVDNCFSMAALRAADGAFLLGEMAPHTYNAGQIYFPAGTPDPTDVVDGKVDLEASVRRELLEEAGINASEAAVAPGWTVVFTPYTIACMKLMTLALPATDAKARIDDYLAQDPHSELSRMHVVGGSLDIDRARVPPFVVAFLNAAFVHRSTG
jgi:8-oxo-dGTP pyrophosphatase MutT (NUDIX family)